ADNNQKVVTRTCRITSVHDGDSMRARCPGFRKTLRIRLEQIDAPEIGQAHGTQARDYLRSLCEPGSLTVIKDKGRDVYHRVLGRVFCNDTDANAAMVEAGMAWVYDYYADDPNLYRLQKAAQEDKKGLWGAAIFPQKPWDFRRRQRNQR